MNNMITVYTAVYSRPYTTAAYLTMELCLAAQDPKWSEYFIGVTTMVVEQVKEI